MSMKPSHKGTRHRAERIFDKINSAISTGLMSPAAVALVAWAFVMAAYVIGRALFNVGWLFVEEFTIYLFVLGSFLGMPYALRRTAHIRVDFVTRMLPKRVRDILAVVTSLLSIGIVGYFAQKGTLWFWCGVETGVRSQFPSHTLLWPVYLFVPIGLWALELGLLLEFYRSVIRLVKSGEES